MRAAWEHRVSDLVTGGTFLEQVAAARRTGVFLFLIATFGWNNDLVDRPTGPKQKTTRTDSDGVFAHGTQKSLVSFRVPTSELNESR
jgi:hypothetical protein